jgi:CheY-like chemotaxis protein
MPPLEIAVAGPAPAISQGLDGWPSARIARIDIDTDVAALLAADGRAPDLILLDAVDGDRPVSTALEARRADDRLRIVPTVVMGAFTDADLVRRAYELRANCCVRRPADPVLLRQRLQVILGFWLGVATLPTWRLRRDELPRMPPAVALPTGERPRILMVDDLLAEGRLVREALKASGVSADLILARSGGEGLERCRQSAPPHLILLDLHLGAEAGHDVLTRLKAEPTTCLTPTLILSSSRQERDIRTAYERWANGYLTKPQTFDGLVELIRRVAGFWLNAVVLPPPARSDDAGRRGA